MLRDVELRELCRAGAIDPYDPDAIQPASIDLRLGFKFRVPVDHSVTAIDLADVREETQLVEPKDGFVLHPGEFALGATYERITIPNDMVGRMEGKSSLGRLGLIVHVTAGFFDPGFSGVGTMEFVNLRRVPIVLRPGRRICQFSFARLSGPVETPYKGRYQGDEGPTGSRY